MLIFIYINKFFKKLSKNLTIKKIRTTVDKNSKYNFILT